MTPDPVTHRELQRLSEVRTQLLANHPFWGHLLLQVALVPSPDLPAFAATDCIRHIWFNPARTQHLTLSELGFVVAHELGHQIFLSSPREGERDPHRWNCATDYAINRIVASIPGGDGTGAPMYTPICREIPGEGHVAILLDPRFDGKIAETIYVLLDEEGLPEPTTVDVTLPVPSAGIDARPPGCVDHGGGLDIHLPIELSPEDQRELEQRIATAIHHANGQGGDAPGNTLRPVVAKTSVVDWRRRLHEHLSPFAGSPSQYNRSRPNRRWLAEGIVVPTLYAEHCGRIVVAVDTSGSMGLDDLAAVLGELRALAPLATELTVLVADTQIHEVLDVEQALERVDGGGWRGGGGTDHRPIFKWIDQRGEPPDVFIGLTDLHTTLPAKPPQYPVFWVLTKDHGEVPWGTAIRLNH